MKTIDINWLSLALIYLLLIIPLAINFWLKLGILRRLLIAVLRMTVQLVLVGIFLQYIFKWNNAWLNFAWLILMMIIASFTIVSNSGLKLKEMIFFIFPAVLISAGPVIAFFIFAGVRPQPFYEARYLIPISGMILGNTLRSNVVMMERFYSTIRKQKKSYLSYLLMGATQWEAVRPFLKEALVPAMAPILSTMLTTGLVSLPGMMTGQMLGGSGPMNAIKYQIAIMIAIFTVISLSCLCTVIFSLPKGFDRYNRLREEIFK